MIFRCFATFAVVMQTLAQPTPKNFDPIFVLPTTVATSVHPASNARLIWTLQLAFNGTDAIMSKPLGSPLGAASQRLLLGRDSASFLALDTDFHNGRIYYTDYASNFLGVFLVKSGVHYNFLKGQSFGIDDVKSDWIRGDVYWIDSETKRISVSDPNFRFYHNITEVDTQSSARLAVHAINRTIYWSERRLRECMMWRSGLDGGNKVMLHSFNDVQAIDFLYVSAHENRLYWSERLKVGRIARVLYFDVNDPMTIHTLLEAKKSRFSGIAYYQGHLYMTDKYQNRLVELDLSTSNLTTFHRPNFKHDRPGTLAVFGPDEQPRTPDMFNKHPCTVASSLRKGCSQLCLATPSGNFTCACGVGFRLASDRRFCQIDVLTTDFMLVVDTSNHRYFQMSLKNPFIYNAVPIPTRGASYAVDFDPVGAKMYWSDVSNKKIMTSSVNGEGVEVFLTGVRVFSMSIDYVSRNLYMIESRSDSIVVASLDLPNVRYTLSIHRMFDVRNIHVSPALGLMFWTDVGFNYNEGQAGGKVEVAGLDGSNRRVISRTALKPNGIAVDQLGKVVYWTETDNSSIGWYNLTNRVSGRYRLHSGQQGFRRLQGMAYYSGHLYFTNFGRFVFRISTKQIFDSSLPQKPEHFGPGVFFSINNVKTHVQDIHRGLTDCHNNRGGCPQICLPTSSKRASCRCADTSQYLAATNTCSAPTIAVGNDTIRPKFTSCPRNQWTLTDPCYETATHLFFMPSATDNSGYVTVKPVTGPKDPYMLQPGEHYFSFKAEDFSGNFALCHYVVQVVARKCQRSLPNITSYESFSYPTCSTLYGSVVNATCRHSNQVSRQYRCGSNEDWDEIFSNPSVCAPVTTTKVQTSTTKQSTTATATTTEAQATTTATATTTTTTEAQATTTAIATTTQTTTGSTAPTERSPVTTTQSGLTKETKSAAENPSAKVHQTTAPNNEGVSNATSGGHVKLATSSGHHLTAGIIAVIVILIVLVIIAAVAVSYRFRNKKSLSSVFWNQTDDQVQLTSEQPIYTESRYRHLSEPQDALL